jgi:hypothetical protein
VILRVPPRQATFTIANGIGSPSTISLKHSVFVGIGLVDCERRLRRFDLRQLLRAKLRALNLDFSISRLLK